MFLEIKNKVMNQKDLGNNTLGDWKKLIDDLVKEYGTEMIVEFVHDSSGDEQKV